MTVINITTNLISYARKTFGMQYKYDYRDKCHEILKRMNE